jgi:uncharacterized protein involved in response to NO
MAHVMQSNHAALAEAFILFGVLGGFFAVLAAALWLVARATGGSGEDELDADIDLREQTSSWRR